MAIATKYDTGSAVAAITSAADLADGNTLLGSEFDNRPAGSNDYMFADLELVLPNGLGVALTAQKPVEVYLIPALDGTNYSESPSNADDTKTPLTCYAGSFMVRATASAGDAQRHVLLGVRLPACKLKVFVRNKTGQTLKDGATHFAVNLYPFRFKQE